MWNTSFACYTLPSNCVITRLATHFLFENCRKFGGMPCYLPSVARVFMGDLECFSLWRPNQIYFTGIQLSSAEHTSPENCLLCFIPSRAPINDVLKRNSSLFGKFLFLKVRFSTGVILFDFYSLLGPYGQFRVGVFPHRLHSLVSQE